MRFFTAIILFLIPASLFANVEITEIMYDVPGSDTGREWIEVRVDTETDISNWKLFESGVNHKLILAMGSPTFPAGGFVVIAGNTEKFLADFPTFSGTLLDSSFSLSNTGETLVMRNNTGTTTDSISYSSSWGARGDGNSLQKDGSIWTYGPPTPGAFFVRKERVVKSPEIAEVAQVPSNDVSQGKETALEHSEANKETDTITETGNESPLGDEKLIQS